MSTIIIYHGTTESNARQIKKNGFMPDIKDNWEVRSKKGFVYLSIAYAPFYAQAAAKRTSKLALIQVEVNTEDCYPDEDYLTCVADKNKHTQEELNTIKLGNYQNFWEDSLQYLGNITAKPNKIKILGIRKFDMKNLIYKCDPFITLMNFKIMGDYYKGLTEWIYAGKDILEYKHSLSGKE